MDSARNPPRPCGLSPSKCFFCFFLLPLQFGPSKVQYSQVIYFLFLPTPLVGTWVNKWTFPPPPPTLSNLWLFVPTWLKKNTSFILTRDPWPTRHDLTSSPSYVITSVCDSFSDRICNLICIVVNNHCISYHHNPLGVLSHAFSSETQRHLYCLSNSGKCIAARPLSCVQSWQVAALLLQWSLIIDGAVTAQSCCKMEDSFFFINKTILLNFIISMFLQHLLA